MGPVASPDVGHSGVFVTTAEAVVLLASGGLPDMSGAVLLLDGGWTAV